MRIVINALTLDQLTDPTAGALDYLGSKLRLTARKVVIDRSAGGISSSDDIPEAGAVVPAITEELRASDEQGAKDVVTALQQVDRELRISPKIVDELSAVDRPFAEVRTQTVSVLFADIVGFTRQCEVLPPAGAIALLREFHLRMEQTVYEWCLYLKHRIIQRCH